MLTVKFVYGAKGYGTLLKIKKLDLIQGYIFHPTKRKRLIKCKKQRTLSKKII